jgi:hypothetical protein
MRIFLGLTDLANITANYAKGFKALGHQVFSVVWNKGYFYPDSEYDLIIDNRVPITNYSSNIFAYLKIFVQLAQLAKALKCDLFIMYAPAVLPTHLYYPILKLLGKKMITAFWGSDIRYWYAFAEEMRSLGVQDEVFPLFEYARTRSGGSYWDKLHTVKVAEKYSDLIISVPDCAQLQTRPYMRAIVPLDLSEYRFNVPGRITPLILHAPSVPEAKGTDIIINAIKELKEEGLEFEFQLIEKMPNRKLRELLADSDIVIDQLYSATTGGLSAEAMASGNVVLTRIMDDYSKALPDCPAVNANMFTLKDNLRKIIRDVDQRKALAYRGRTYVETYNDHIKVCKNLLTWLSQKDDINYDFHPTFYTHFHPPEKVLRDEKQEKSRNLYDFFRTLLSTGSTKKR